MENLTAESPDQVVGPDVLNGVLDQIMAKDRQIQTASVEQLSLITFYLEHYRAQDPNLAEADGLPEVLHEHFEQLGGEGTPDVSEDGILELGARLRRSQWSIRKRGASGLDLRDRLPQVWAACSQGAVEFWVALKIAELSRDLPLERCLWLDARLAQRLNGLPASRQLTIARALVIEADSELAARKAAETKAARYVGVRPDKEGGAWLTGKLDVLDAQQFVGMADRLTDVMLARGDYQGPRPVVRAQAVGVMGNPALALAMLQQAAEPGPGTESTTALAETPEPAVVAPATTTDASGHLDTGIGSHAELETPPELRDVPAPPEPDFEGPDVEPADPMARQFLPQWLLDVPAATGLEPPPLDEAPAWAAADPADPSDRLPGHSGHLCGRIDVPLERLLPKVSLIVHISDQTAQNLDGVARVEGYGAAHFAALLPELRHTKVNIRPVIDLNQIPGVDRYEIPDAIREAVIQRDLYEPFPGSTRTSRHLDQDHIERWVDTGPSQGSAPPISRAAGEHCACCHAGAGSSGEQPESATPATSIPSDTPPQSSGSGSREAAGRSTNRAGVARSKRGCPPPAVPPLPTRPSRPTGPPPQTRIDNLAPLSRRLHRTKTAGRWQVRRDGVDLVWRSPMGRQYRVRGDGSCPDAPYG